MRQTFYTYNITEKAVITDERTFHQTAKAFYDNSQCNSLDEFNEDINKIGLMKTHFCRYDLKGATNYRLLMNHFISFVNCFGLMSEELLKYRLPQEHHTKVDALYVLIGHKKFDGNTTVHEEFFAEIHKNLKG